MLCNQVMSLDAEKYRSSNKVNTERSHDMPVHRKSHADACIQALSRFWKASVKSRQDATRGRQADTSPSSNFTRSFSWLVTIQVFCMSPKAQLACQGLAHTTQGPQRCMTEDWMTVVAALWPGAGGGGGSAGADAPTCGSGTGGAAAVGDTLSAARAAAFAGAGRPTCGSRTGGAAAVGDTPSAARAAVPAGSSSMSAPVSSSCGAPAPSVASAHGPAWPGPGLTPLTSRLPAAPCPANPRSARKMIHLNLWILRPI